MDGNGQLEGETALGPTGEPMVAFRTILVCLSMLAAAAHSADISYDRDIRPILSENCFACHGPDPESRKAGLRLDTKDGATAIHDGHAAIVPGQPDESALIRRIVAADPEERMPPAETGKVIKPEQIELIRRWIAEGAEWPQHWAFVPPQRPPVPGTANTGWARNPIDSFVLQRLEREGLAPSPEADPLTLLRRASLDITGLPPSPEEIEDYLADDPATAYESAVERLLASPHFGERWARHWLDAAQFADSDGFEKDKPRQVWAWRDWVINALNNNMPYDRFVREQIAGDMLPGATQDQIVATGFLRNSLNNEEGGIDPEQFRMEALFNRMDVIGRAVLGLTVQCAQCHTHKYDPLTHEEYFRLFAYINNADEACMTVYTPEEQAERAELHKKIGAELERAKAEAPQWASEISAWEDTVRAQPRPAWHPVAMVFDDSTAGGQKCLPVGDGSYLAQGYAPTRNSPKSAGPSPLPTITAVRLDLLTDPNLPRGGPGRSVYGACALSEFELRVGPADGPFEEFDKWERIEIASAIADVDPPSRALGARFGDRDGPRKSTVGGIALAIDKDANTAWTTEIDPGRTNQPRHAIFKLAAPLHIAPGMKLGFRLVQNQGGWNSDDNQTNNLGRFKVSVTDAANLPGEAIPAAVLTALDKPQAARSVDEDNAIFAFWMSRQPSLAARHAAVEALWQQHPAGDTQLVYHERKEPRATHVLTRGDFLQPAAAVTPGTPAFLHAPPRDALPNRLGLAEWLTDRSSPTTARAMVNRTWQHYFGTGIVATAADLGSQGEPPSHPELLDWLAVELMDSGWDVKAIHRMIATSAAYRQSSRVTPELLERDPANRLLARGARFRVDGEIVRDIALAASGLLDPAVGGPSVFPPAPAFLFEPPASYGPKPWVVNDGDGAFRRALYTFRFRSVPYPALQAFDVPPGDAPCTRRVRSNTPLQALTTLNEPVFLDCARALAGEVLADIRANDAERLANAFRRCTGRAPEAAEVDVLQQFLDKQRKRLADGALNPQTILGGGEARAGDRERAAWTLTARVILNLDETITRE